MQRNATRTSCGPLFALGSIGAERLNATGFEDEAPEAEFDIPISRSNRFNGRAEE